MKTHYMSLNNSTFKSGHNACAKFILEGIAIVYVFKYKKILVIIGVRLL